MNRLFQYYQIVRCEDLAEIIWLNRQQIRQLEMIHEGLNIPSQVSFYSINLSICMCLWYALYFLTVFYFYPYFCFFLYLFFLGDKYEHPARACGRAERPPWLPGQVLFCDREATSPGLAMRVMMMIDGKPYRLFDRICQHFQLGENLIQCWGRTLGWM